MDVGGQELTAIARHKVRKLQLLHRAAKSNEVDTFGKLSNDDVKARVQNFYTQLANDPTAQGYIINYGTPKEIAARRLQITKAIAFLKLDPSRVTFVDGGDKGTGIETHFFMVPPGATPPAP